MKAEVRAELDRIEDFLMRRDQASADLAAILTALRGPDSDNHREKTAATIPIRHLVFPRIAEQVMYDDERSPRVSVSRSRFMAFGYTPHTIIEVPQSATEHFKIHVEMAKEAIERTS